MGYRVKWVEEHLGVSRKALRLFEQVGLMQPKLNLQPGQIEFFLSAASLVKAVCRRMALGPSHPEVQLIIKILFDEATNCFEMLDGATPEQFGRVVSSGFIAGDTAIMLQDMIGKEACVFLADAIAIFGGYKNFEDSL